MSEQPKTPPEPPRDYVAPRQRVDVDQHVSKVTSALEKPTSVLLFTVLIVGIVMAVSWWSDAEKNQILQEWLTQIEDHRAEEVIACQTTLRQVLSQVGQRIDYEAYTRGKSE